MGTLSSREGYVAGAPALKLALRAFRDEPLSREDEVKAGSEDWAAATATEMAPMLASPTDSHLRWL